MTLNNLNDFEQQLGFDLTQIAKNSGPGPQSNKIVHVVMRRSKRNKIVKKGAIVTSGFLLLLTIGLLVKQMHVDMNRTLNDIENPIEAATKPLPAGSFHSLVKKEVLEYIKKHKIQGGFLVEKSPLSGVSFAFWGSGDTTLKKYQIDLERLFERFDWVTLEVNRGQVRYALLTENFLTYNNIEKDNDHDYKKY